MKERPDLNKLSMEILEANKAKGFHDVKTSNEHYLMLVITGLSEAVEAHRRSKWANAELYKSLEKLGLTLDEKMAFEVFVKDTVEDELADTVIRLLDLSGLLGIDINLNFERFNVTRNQKFTENIYFVIEGIFSKAFCFELNLVNTIVNIEHLCKIMSIDLWLHVQWRMKYNESREHKHGKKAY